MHAGHRDMNSTVSEQTHDNLIKMLLKTSFTHLVKGIPTVTWESVSCIQICTLRNE